MKIAERVGIGRFFNFRREPKLVPDVTAEQVRTRRLAAENGREVEYSVDQELVIPNRLFTGEEPSADVLVTTHGIGTEWNSRAVPYDPDKKLEYLPTLGIARFSASSVKEATLITDDWIQNSASSTGRTEKPVDEKIKYRHAETVYRLKRS